MAKKKGNNSQSQRSNDMSNENEQSNDLTIDPAQPVDVAQASAAAETAGDNTTAPEGAAKSEDQAANDTPAGEPAPSTAQVQVLVVGGDTALNTAAIAALSTGDIQAVSTGDVLVIGTGDIGALSTAAIQSLSGIDVPALAPEEPAAAPDPVATAVVTNQAADTAAAVNEEAKPTGIVGSLDENASGAAKLALSELADFISESTYALTRRVTEERGAAMQSSLYRALKGAVNAPAADFEKVMNIFLDTIHAHRNGVFHETKVLHHMPHLNLQAAHITSFKKLVNLFTSLADKQSRGLAKKQINWTSTLEHRDIKEESRQRVLGFFNI